jgi:GTP-binding protein HflX
MGEKQIEMDKRQIRIEIAKVKQELEKIQRQKETQRKMRDTVKKVCLVGYTNAGKSTLFNRLTDAGVLEQDKLFATLGTTTRKVEMERGHGIILSDTVGFIADLPHHLVASFRATLRDVQDADLLLHVVDSSDPDLPHYIEEVDKVLGQIDAQNIQQLMVFNKIDLCNKDTLAFITQTRPTSIAISARQGQHIDQLLEQIDKLLYQSLRHTLLIPHSQQKSAHTLFELAEIETREYTENGLKVTAIIHQNDLPKFKQFIV